MSKTWPGFCPGLNHKCYFGVDVYVLGVLWPGGRLDSQGFQG